MKVTLLGCGQMGRGAAYALATDERITEVTLVDRDAERASGLARWLVGHSDCRMQVNTEFDTVVRGRDAVAMAVPWAPTRTAIHAAVRAHVPVASITRPPYDEMLELDKDADQAGVAVLLPIGLEPGLTELMAVHLAERIAIRSGRVTALDISCGGIPRVPREPLGYTAFFGGEQDNHLPIAQRMSLGLVGGQVVSFPRFSGVEERQMEGVGLLEAYHDGMVPWLAEHPALNTTDCSQKTLRWPGFAQVVTDLARLGLLDEHPVDVDGVQVTPKRLVERVITPRLRARPGEEDIVVLEVTARGEINSQSVIMRTRLLDYYDKATGLSAIARTTGFSLAAVTMLLAERALIGPGWVRPHLALVGSLFERLMAELCARGVSWLPPYDDRATSTSSFPEGMRA